MYPDIENSLLKVEDHYIKKILTPYHDHCHYLKNLDVHINEHNGVKELVGKGNFGIASSCYIDDTGHFNAVEFNICFNQLAYTFFGYCILKNLIPELNMYKGEIFFQNQLSHLLIAKISSSYKTEINAKKFKGEIGIKSLSKRSTGTFVNTYCNFEDGINGKSTGEILVVLLNP